MSKTHVGITKLELYKYKFNDKKLQESKPHIPSVYYDFIWNNHEKYQGYLSVQLTYCPPPQYQIVGEGDIPNNLFQE